MLRIPSPLPDDLELLVTQTIGCCVRVHCALGPGLLESIYAQALCIEQMTGIPFERERAVVVTYRHRKIPGQRVDLIVGGAVIVEIKSVEALAPIHFAQVLTYLRLSKRRLGILINFNVPQLKEGVRRIANDLPDP